MTKQQEEDNGEIYSEWLDNLTIADIDKLVMQNYHIVTSNGHIIAILPNGRHLADGK